jgi:hypothetical protein
VDFLRGFVTRESWVKIKVQRGTDAIEVDFDARVMDEARVEVLVSRLQRRLGQR